MSEENRDEQAIEEAEHEEGPAGTPPACTICQAPLQASYYTVNGHPSCESCASGLHARFTGGSGFARFVKSVVFGLAAGLLGALLYWGVTKISGYELSLIAIAVGWLVGKAISIGNGHRGGKRYQLLAVAMTWGAMAAAYVPFLDEAMLAEEPAAVEAAEGAQGESLGDEAGLAGPAASELAPGERGETIEEGGFASLPTPVRWIAEYPVALVLPFLGIMESPIGFVIFLIGLWTAWGTNKKVQLAITGPHELQAAGAMPPPLHGELPPTPTGPDAPDDACGALPPTPRE